MAEPRRVRREKRTIVVMIGMYCRAHHASAGDQLCPSCAALRDYALARIDRCPLCPDKPTCANCAIHCYKKDRRAEVREVMRWAGPRMLRRHPLLAVLHVLDGRRRARLPERRPRSTPGEGDGGAS